MGEEQKNLPPEQVAELSRTVWYEIAMLRDTYHAAGNLPGSDRFLENARLEAFLLHARQLVQFFRRPRSKGQDEDTDGYAADLLDDEGWQAVADCIPDDLCDACKEIGAQIMHVTLKRDAECGNRGWSVDAIYDKLDRAWRTLYERADRRNWADIWAIYSEPSIGAGLPPEYRNRPGAPSGAYQPSPVTDADHTDLSWE